MPLEPLLPNPLPPNPFTNMPMFRHLLLLVAGVLTAWLTKEVITWEYWLAAAAASTIVCIGLLFTSFNNPQNRWRIAVAGMAAIGLAAAALTQKAYEQTVVKWPEQQITLLGNITQVLKQYDGGGAIVEMQLKAPGKDWDQHKVRVRLVGKEIPKVGNELAFAAKINEETTKSFPDDFDYNRYLLLHGVSGSAYTTYWKEMKADRLSWRSQLLRWRDHLLKQYGDFFENEDLAILSALTLGDKSRLENETKQLFSNTGTSHVLALSGLHLSIIFSLLQILLLHKGVMRRRVILFTNLLIVVALWGFVFLAGAPLSLLRSAVMLTLLHLGALFHYNRHATLNNLFIAAFVLLLCDPFSLFDVGFQLSFTAVFSILMVNSYVWQRFPLPVWRDPKYLATFRQARPTGMRLRKYWRFYKYPLFKTALRRNAYHLFRDRLVPFVGVSLSAQWGTMPLVLYYFHTLAPYAWIANFLVIPAAYILLNGALFFFLLPFPTLRWALSAVMKWVLTALTTGLSSISHWPGAAWQPYPTLLTLAQIWLLPLLIYAFFQLRRRKRRLRIVYLTFALLTLSLVGEAFDAHQRQLQPSIYVYRIPQTEVIHFVVSSKTSYLLSSTTPDSTHQRMSYVEQRFFKPHEVATPIYIRSDHEQHEQLVRSGDFFDFRHQRIFHLHHRIELERGKKPIKLSLLIVSKGCKQSFSEVKNTLLPQRVMLSPTLSAYYRKTWLAECQKAGIPCQVGGWVKWK